MFEYLGLMISVIAWIVAIAAVIHYKKRSARRGNDAWTALHIFQSHLEPDKAEILQVSQEEKSQENEDGAPPDKELKG